MKALMEKIKTNKRKEEDFAQLIIETLFGFILRKESISQYISDLDDQVPNRNISERFLIAFLLQCSDMGLRARLTYYLSQNSAVPLVMNDQSTFMENEPKMDYLFELIFTMSEKEGVGVFSYGIGKKA